MRDIIKGPQWRKDQFVTLLRDVWDEVGPEIHLGTDAAVNMEQYIEILRNEELVVGSFDKRLKLTGFHILMTKSGVSTS